jgi:hypothetical protein
MRFTVKRKKIANAPLVSVMNLAPIVQNINGKHPIMNIGGNIMSKQSKKDGGTKQKGKNKPNQKTSGSANGQNGYH